MKKRVAVFSKYNSQGASSRYRFYNYQEYFSLRDIEIEFFPLLGEDYVLSLYNKNRLKVVAYQLLGILKRIWLLLFGMRKFDFLIIEKELIPNCPFFIESFLLRGKRFSLDFDDYIGTSYKINRFKKIFFFHKIDYLCNKARFVTVGNHWYFNEIKSNNLIYLPTVVDLNNYNEVKNHYPKPEVTLVWIGSPTTAKYLNNLKSILQELSKNRKLKLKVIGGDFNASGVKVELVKWDSQTEVDEILSGDIGLMPLNDTLWEKGKCGFKLIQYMACGLPVVASSSPANEEIIVNSKSGYIANDLNQWSYYLNKLMTEYELRNDLGHYGRTRVKDFYSYQVWGTKFADLIYENC